MIDRYGGLKMGQLDFKWYSILCILFNISKLADGVCRIELEPLKWPLKLAMHWLMNSKEKLEQEIKKLI